MITRKIYYLLIYIVISISCADNNKKTIEVVDFDGLFHKIDLSSNKTFVVNFWATWCSPCLKELPHFEFINSEYLDKDVKVILVSLDFPSQIKTRLIPYLKKNKINSNVILLDDSEINSWVPKVSKDWDGGIPATLIINNSSYSFYPKPFDKEELTLELDQFLD